MLEPDPATAGPTEPTARARMAAASSTGVSSVIRSIHGSLFGSDSVTADDGVAGVGSDSAIRGRTDRDGSWFRPDLLPDEPDELVVEPAPPSEDEADADFFFLLNRK